MRLLPVCGCCIECAAETTLLHSTIACTLATTSNSVATAWPGHLVSSGCTLTGRFSLFYTDKLKKKEEARKLRESLEKKGGGGH